MGRRNATDDSVELGKPLCKTCCFYVDVKTLGATLFEVTMTEMDETAPLWYEARNRACLLYMCTLDKHGEYFSTFGSRSNRSNRLACTL